MTLIKIAYFLLSAICLFLIIRGLQYSLSRSGLSTTQQKTFRNRFYVIVGGWIALISALSLSGTLSDFTSFPPPIMVVLVPPMIAMIIFTVRSESLKQILKAIPIQWLLYLQSFRIVVELMLWYQYDLGITPIQMTFEGNNLDIIAGITGPIVGFLYAKKRKSMKRLVVAWNVLGLALLINVIVVALLSFPTKIRYFMNEPSNYMIAEFPFIWLPGLLVTIAYSLHYFSLKQVLYKK